ncbi:hypothetical protein FXO37_35576 [Capsicum annuum]|nr:hypothetical protein FXO37_35576 [Capsicum annuum]
MLAIDNNISNHKILKSNSKDSSGHSSNSLNNHLKPKSWTSSSVLDSSCTPLTKSKNQHGNSTMVKVKKVPHNKGNKEFNKEVDVKRGCVNLSKSQEIERFKEFDEIKKQSLLALQFKNGGRRKSFCSSKIELGDFFICSGVKVVSLDMPPFMQIHAINRARKTHDSLENSLIPARDKQLGGKLGTRVSDFWQDLDIFKSLKRLKIFGKIWDAQDLYEDDDSGMSFDSIALHNLDT